MLPIIKKVSDIGQKIFLVIIVYSIIFSLFFYFSKQDKPKQVYSDPVKTNRQEIYKQIASFEKDKTNQGKLSLLLYRLMNCKLMGEACTDNPNDADKNYKSSLMGFAGNLVIIPFMNPPASGVYWAFSGLQNAGFIPKTYAAEGIGMSALLPFSNLWKVFRDISYILLVIVLVAIGFMIMFRMKLNPQTVISIENALPRIVVSLILITFSFAIAGFLIDLMYVIMAVSISIVSNNNMYYNASEFQNQYLNSDFGRIGNALIPSNMGILGDIGLLLFMGNQFLVIFGGFLNGAVRTILGLVSSFGVMKLMEGVKGIQSLLEGADVISVLGISLGKIPSAIGKGAWGLVIIPIIGFALGFLIVPQLILGFLFLITVLFLMFRIFMLLFKAYIEIIIMVIFSPIILLFNAIPGKNAFGYWFKNLLASLITFPIIILIFVLAYVMVNTIPATPNLWTPPFLGGMDSSAYAVFISMGLLFVTPSIVKMVKELMGVKGLPLDIGPSTFFAGAGSAVGGGIGLLSGFSSMTLALPGLQKAVLGRVPGLKHWVRKDDIITTPPRGQPPASPPPSVPPQGSG